ncbi:MAG: lysozyme [Alphaproteobacteria bacterium]|nr:lysozyme [Alphaproteobacteria bacterium]
MTISPRMKITGLAVSGAALISIAVHEGFRSGSYSDIAGVTTVGFGSTGGVKPGETVSVERALIRLGDHVAKDEVTMRACIGNVPLHQYEWDAYVSFTYNLGADVFCKSSIVKRLRQTPPDYAGACAVINLYNKAGGKVVPGLVTRRQKEYERCMNVQSP